MSKTTVYISLTIGAQEPAYPAYVAFRSPYRFVDGVTTVLPEPAPVILAEDGTGTVSVQPGIWLVDEILPTQVIRRAVVVPVSTGIVQYSTLAEVSNPVEIGYGPTWAQTALEAAGDAQRSAENAQDLVRQAEEALALAAATTDALMKAVATAVPESDFMAVMRGEFAELPDTGGSKAVGKGELMFNVKDYGTAFSAVGAGGDDTAAIRAAMAAAAPTGGTVLFPCGTYRAEDLKVPAFVVLKGMGQNSRYAGNTINGGGKAAVRIIRPGAGTISTSDLPMVTVAGAGAGLEDIQLEGLAAPGTILVMQGFESVLRWVRVISGSGIGIDVQKANNVKWIGLYVDNCGSTTLPAMKIWSAPETGNANETNNLDIMGLRIERSRNRALTVATGGTTAAEYVEWLKILFFHVENSYLDYPNTDPLIEFGNVRTVDLIAPMLYGGPAEIIRHNQLYAANAKTYGLGGITIIGGSLVGSDTALTQNSRQEPITALPTPNLVRLMAGTGFRAIGTRFLRFSELAIAVDETYGHYSYDESCEVSALAAYPNASVTGRPSLVAASGIVFGTSPLYRKSSDKVGRVFFGTGAAPAAGTLVQVKLYHPSNREFEVVAFAKGDLAAGLGLYTGIAGDGKSFTINARNAPAANAGTSAYQVGYIVRYFDQ